MPYSGTEAVLNALQHQDVLTPRLDGFRRLTKAFENEDTTARVSFVRFVFESVRYFSEMWEEGNSGHTKIMKLLRPSSQVAPLQLRKLVLHACFQTRRMGLLEASMALVEYCCDRGLAPAVDDDDLSELGIMCSSASRPFTLVSDPAAIRKRSFVRLACYLSLRGMDSDTRCFEYFLRGVYDVPTGQGKNGGTYNEHVVPLAYIRKHCVHLLTQGGTAEQATSDIIRFLAIVKITDDERNYLDRSISSGGLGLQVDMPEAWYPEVGDIFARLHKAGIEFQMST